jgi:hypothetical protein
VYNYTKGEAKMKKTLACIGLCILVCLMLIPMIASADIGPKSCVIIKFSNLDEKAYVTLLSKHKSTGAYSVDYPPEDEIIGENREIWEKFWAYQDKDGYYFLNKIDELGSSKIYQWGYYPPNDFKVLVYLPDSDTFICSNAEKAYAFKSSFLAVIEQIESSHNSKVIVLSKDYNFIQPVLSFFARVAGTIIIEVLVALVFGYVAKNQLKLILLTNAGTQVILNLALSTIAFYFGGLSFLFWFFWIELVVFVIEAIVYAYVLTKHSSPPRDKKYFAVIYAVVANIASVVIGLILSYNLPGVF